MKRACNSQGFCIEYRIAPSTIMQPPDDADKLVLGEFDLGERPEIEMRIYRMANGGKIGGPVRTIAEGYDADSYPSPRYQPHGKFEVQADEPATDLLLGTCAYWDGLWDTGAEIGGDAGIRDDPPPTGVYYAAFLSVDGVLLEGAGEFFPFRKSI